MGPRLARLCPVRIAARDLYATTRHHADCAYLRAWLCGLPLCRLRLAPGLSEDRSLPREDDAAAVGQGHGAAAGVVCPWSQQREPAMSLTFTAGDLTIHRVIEDETTFRPALEFFAGLTPELLAENRSWLQ